MSEAEAIQNPDQVNQQAGVNLQLEFNGPVADYRDQFPPVQLADTTRWYQRVYDKLNLRAFALATTMALGATGLAACGSGSSSSHSHSTTPRGISAECNSTSEYLANTNATGPESFFPSLYNSNNQLVSASEAQKTLINEVCNDVRTLAVFSAINELFNNQTLPSTDIVGRIAKLESNYTANPGSREQAEQDVVTLLIPGLKLNKDFAITTGQVSQLQAVKNGTDITGIRLANPNLNSLSLTGFEFNPNTDNTNLTPSEVSFYNKLSSLILVAPDGTIYFNNLISKNPTSAQFAKTTTKVNATPKGTQNTQAFQGTGNNQGVSKGKTPESNPNGPNQGPGAGPNGAGTTPEAGPGQGNTPGTGGNQGGGETPTTTVTSSTVPVTTIPTTTTTQPIKTGLPTSTTTIPTGNPFNPSIRIESHSVNVRSISY